MAIIRESSRNVEKAKKQLCAIFKNNGLKITIEANRKIINFLDVTLDLTTGSYKPYLKPGNKPTYVHTSSNHPPSIIKNIAAARNKRLSAISYDEESFNSAVEVYQGPLKDSGYTHTLKYTKGDDKAQKRRRRRNITWYNPPYNIATSTKVAKRFLNIVTSAFGSNHPLRKIFNRNTIKVSYS